MQLINHIPDPNNPKYHIAEIEINSPGFNGVISVRFKSRNQELDNNSKLKLSPIGLTPSQVMGHLRAWLKDK